MQRYILSSNVNINSKQVITDESCPNIGIDDGSLDFVTVGTGREI